MSGYANRERLAALYQEQVDIYVAKHKGSKAAHERANVNLLGGVPMIWMKKWPGPFPLYVKSAKGGRFQDIDDNDFTDLCLGDTGAMTGHSPAATVKAVQEQVANGVTLMLPTEKAQQNASLLADRFGLPIWQFTLSATDANRHLIRYAREVTGRPKIAVHDWCYHGTVDETFAVLDDHGNTVARKDNIGKPTELHNTTWSVPFNDLAATEKAFQSGEIAAFLMEPALTNIGIVLPEPGYLEGVQALCQKYDVIWILDETHTLSAGIGGMTADLKLSPDAVVLGKTIGGGIPVGTFGLSQKLANRISTALNLETIDVGGVGGTLAGNALSMAAVHATLGEVLTAENFAHMTKLAKLWEADVQAVIDEHQLPWQVSRIGCRAEFSFRESAPKTGRDAADAEDFELQQFLQLHAINNNVLMTPFHNMALFSPESTIEDVKRHDLHFRKAVAALLG